MARIAGLCALWVGWACGSGYRVAFAVFGVLAWGAGSVWYARRHRRWPSALSARLFKRLLGERAQPTRIAPPAVLVVRGRRR